MKTLRNQLLTLVTASTLLVSFAYADDSLYAKILKERDSALSQILTEREARVATGVSDEDTLLAARLALWSFRRDTASSQAEKLKQQDLIVALHGKRLEWLKSRAALGAVGHEDVLLATDLFLHAQQVREELKKSSQ